MGRKALHTQEQVFKAADGLVAAGVEVTPTALRETLGGGSMTTIYKHLAAWEETRKATPAPAAIAMPGIVQQQFAAVWQALSIEAGREIAAIREKADADTKAIKRRLDEALGAIEQLEAEAETDAGNLEAAQAALAEAQDAAQRTRTEAAAREAALQATAEQQARQIETIEAELGRVHDESAAIRSQHQAEIGRLSEQIAEQSAANQAAQTAIEGLRAQLREAGEKQEAAAIRERGLIEDAAKARADGARLADHLADLQARFEGIEKAYHEHRQNSAKEAHHQAERYIQAQGERDAARAEAAQAREEAAKLRGQVEALQVQVTDQFRAFVVRSGSGSQDDGAAKSVKTVKD